MIPWNKGKTKESDPRITKSGFQKGHKGFKYWLGKKMPKKARLNMSKAQKGTTRPRKPQAGSYSAVHHYLRRHFGTPTYCQNKLCKNTSVIFDRALIQGKKYSYLIEDYYCLCRRCHLNYDRGGKIKI